MARRPPKRNSLTSVCSSPSLPTGPGRLLCCPVGFAPPPVGVTLTAARDFLVLRTAADLEPVVTNANVETFLNECKLADSAGRAPTDAAWVPTWDLDLAEAMIYERKAALISQQVTFERDGSKFDLTDRVNGYKERAEKARRRRIGGVGVELTLAEDALVVTD